MTAKSQGWEGMRVLVLSPTPTHPQDFGNRKRIHEICRRLTAGGAHIAFVHYPAEQEWRATKPRSAERAMQKAWDQYYTIAPTRPFHMHPAGLDHAIDEWWDPSIGNFLKWLFSVQSFDVFIVNYAWLSKAFEFAPAQVFKILDAHDKVSGRRGMLASLGLDPEFFHTTEAEESIALDRADLVWAIKREECKLFSRMTERPVLPLPHLDPYIPLARPEPDPEGYLRVGIMGARNNVNRANITAFLREATPILLSAFAPVKIVIGGTVCETLLGLNNPLVEMRGPVGNVEDFYKSVDCIAVPMQSSTGLKIKTGEAISFGLPVLSLAHAFEGYDGGDSLHLLPDFAALAHALVDLSFAERNRLAALAQASQRAHETTSRQIEETFVRTAKLACAHARPVVVAVDTRSLIPGTVFHICLASMVERLERFANVSVLAVRGSLADVARHPGAADRFRRIVAARELAGDGCSAGDMLEMGIELTDTGAYLEKARPVVLIADALHPALFRGHCPDTVFVARSELIAHSEGKSDFPIPETGFAQAFVATPAISRDLAVRIAVASIEPVLETCLWQSSAIAAMRVPDHSGIKTVALLGRPESAAVKHALAMAESWKLRPLIVAPIGEPVADASSQGAAVADAGEFLTSIAAKRVAPPKFAVDLSAGATSLQLVREILERLHVPTAAAHSTSLHRSMDFSPLPLDAGTEGELWQVFRWLSLSAEQDIARTCEQVWRRHEGARDWAWLTRRYRNAVAASKAA
jgi:hypothetical protein